MREEIVIIKLAKNLYVSSRLQQIIIQLDYLKNCNQLTLYK